METELSKETILEIQAAAAFVVLATHAAAQPGFDFDKYRSDVIASLKKSPKPNHYLPLLEATLKGLNL